jgi:hypothetical protein
MKTLASRIERLEKALSQAGCACAEHTFACVEVQHRWTEKQMDAAAKTTWFTCPVHGYRAPKTLVFLLRFGR